MPRVVHFEINSNDPEKSMKFYKGVFDWEFDKWKGPLDYWLIKTGDKKDYGINGGLMKRKDPDVKINPFIDVSSIDEFIKKIEDNGGKIVVPKHPVPGVGYCAYFMDPDENLFGMMERDETVK
jgi:predicted enzyme related to lactoylglutathione lyase